MWQIAKSDFMMNWQIIGLTFLLPLFILTVKLPNVPLTTYLMLFILLFAYTFYFDRKNHVNRTIISLPIHKNKIVLGRYLFLLSTSISFLFFLWLLENILFQTKAWPGSIVLLTFTLLSLAIAVSFPIYIIHSFIAAAFVQFTVLLVTSLGFLFLAGSPYTLFDPFFSFFFDLIDIQPVVTLLTLSFLSLAVSYLFSCWIFVKKDHV